jgi:hypothetical protein
VVSPAALRPRTAGELGGLIVAGGAPVALQRDVVIKLAARHRLPVLYSDHALGHRWWPDGVAARPRQTVDEAGTDRVVGCYPAP